MPLNAGGIGAALNGLIPQLQAAQQQQRQRQQQIAAFQAMQQMAQQGQSGGAPPALPGGAPMPQVGAPVPGGPQGPMPASYRPGAPVGGMPPGPMPQQTGPQISQMPQGAGGAQPEGGQPNPRNDMFQMIDIVSKMPISDDQKMAVLQQTGAFMSPLEKYTQAMDMQMQKLEAAKTSLDEKQKTLVQLQQMRDATSSANTGARVGVTERGQDMGFQAREDATQQRADAAQARIEVDEKKNAEHARHDESMEFINSQKLLSEQQKTDLRAKETERHNKAMEGIGAQRADTYQEGTAGRLMQGEEGMKIKQQNADTASDRAGTYKYGTMRAADTRQQNADTAAKREKSYESATGSRVQLDAAKIKAMESKVSPENKKPFQAASASYAKAAALYQSLTKPGVVVNPASQADIDFAKQKMDAAQEKMTQLAGQSGVANAPDAAKITPENLEFTAKKYGITVDEVKKRLGVQ